MEVKDSSESDEEGVSPVVGTILIIGITVIAIAGIAYFVMSYEPPEPGPLVSLEFRGAKVRAVSFSIEHRGGDLLEVKDLTLRINGKDRTGSITSTGTFGAGTSIKVSIDPNSLDYGDRIALVHEPSGAVIAKKTVKEVLPGGGGITPGWTSVESWSGGVSAPSGWSLVMSWSGQVGAPSGWQLIESWSGTVSPEYHYVQNESIYEGWTTGVSGAQADEETYENIYENDYEEELVSNGNFDEGDGGWTLDNIRNEGEAGFDGGNSNTADGSGSIYISGSATGRWGGGQREEATWTQSIGPTSSTVTVNGAFRKDLFWESGLLPAEITAATVRIELYDSGDDDWHTVYENIDIDYGDTSWTEFSPVDSQYTPIDQVTRVRAYAYLQYTGGFDWTWQGGWRDLTARGKIWVDDISVTVPAYRENVQHDITGILQGNSYELQLEYYLNGDGENVMLYLENFSSGSWIYIDNLDNHTATEQSPALFTYDLTPYKDDFLSNGGAGNDSVHVRYVQPENDYTRTDLLVDYTRVKVQG